MGVTDSPTAFDRPDWQTREICTPNTLQLPDVEYGLVDMRTIAAVYDAAESGEVVAV